MNVKLVKVPEELLKALNNIKEKENVKENVESDIRFSLSGNIFSKIKGIYYDDFEEEDYNKQFLKKELKPTFYDLIIKYADRLNIEDSVLYKKAYVDRRLFSKIRQGHKPGLKTVIRLGLALELNNEEFNDFLNSCNYSLYEDKYFDVAIKYFVNNKIYDIDKCNDILYSCKLDLLVDYKK